MRFLRSLLVLIAGMSPIVASGQGTRFQSTAQTVGYINGTAVVKPVQTGYVSVCLVSGSACNQATIYSDMALTQPMGNPILLDKTGNFGFWAPSGAYKYAICSSPSSCTSFDTYLATQGPPFVVRGVWSSTVTYNIGEVVTYGNSVYMSSVGANLNHQPDVSPSQWSPISLPGSLVTNPSTDQTVAQPNGTNLFVNALNREAYVVGDAKQVNDASITSGSNQLTSVSAGWTSADIGKTVIIQGAGTTRTASESSESYPTTLVGAITAVSGNTATLSASAANSVTGAEAFYGTDKTSAIQTAINSNAIKVTLEGNMVMTTVTVSGVTNKTIEINGQIQSAVPALVTGTDNCLNNNGMSMTPMFAVTNTNSLTIRTVGAGFLVNNHHEAIQMLGSNSSFSNTHFLAEVHVLGTGIGTEFNGFVLESCDDCTVNNTIVDAVTRLPNAQTYGCGAGLYTFNTRNLKVANSTFSRNRYNGILQSAGVYTTVNHNTFFRNNMDGFQSIFNIAGPAGYTNSNQFITFTNNNASENTADGWDFNAVTPINYNVNLVVSGNSASHNGWFPAGSTSTGATPDGSGIGTYAFIKGFSVTNNTSLNSYRACLYLSNVSDFEVSGNVCQNIDPSGGGNYGIGNGIQLDSSTRGTISDNQFRMASPLEALHFYGVNSDIKISSNHFIGTIAIPNAGAGQSYAGVVFENNTANTSVTLNDYLPIMRDNQINVSGANGVLVNGQEFSGNTVTVTGGYGVTVNSSFATVSRNRITSDGAPLTIEGTSELVSNNTLISLANSPALFLDAPSVAIVMGNSLTPNTSNSILQASGSTASLIGNTCTGFASLSGAFTRVNDCTGANALSGIWAATGSATVNRAACVKTTSPQVLGYCSTQPDSSGACTCN